MYSSGEGLPDEETFNRELDSNERLKSGLDRLARAYPDMTKDEYVEEMLCLFKEAGLFLTRIQLEKLLALRRRGSSPITKTE